MTTKTLAVVFTHGQDELVDVGNKYYTSTNYSYAQYCVLFARTNVTHVLCSLGLEGGPLGDGMHNVEEFLGALQIVDAATHVSNAA